MANLKVGIVGLPNVGKSTLFNALTGSAVAAENYPFCTVDPNVGVVPVPDPRLDRLHSRLGVPGRIPATVRFVDIAGLVRGAARGEGLGNQFLAHIREADALAHLIRCFDEPDVSHIMDTIDPTRDREIVNAELLLADLEVVERRLARVEKLARTGDKDAKAETALLRRAASLLESARPARLLDVSEKADVGRLYEYHLLTCKPELYVANVAESDLPATDHPCVHALRVALEADAETAEVVPLSVRFEAELLQLDPAERDAFLAGFGLQEPGLDRLIHAAYQLLGLITFFTANEKEVRAWTVRRGTPAARAAGRIHTDFERGFIRAETLAWDDFDEAGSMKAAREMGLVRSEGRDYEVQDGDTILFRFNV